MHMNHMHMPALKRALLHFTSRHLSSRWVLRHGCPLRCAALLPRRRALSERRLRPILASCLGHRRPPPPAPAHTELSSLVSSRAPMCRRLCRRTLRMLVVPALRPPGRHPALQLACGRARRAWALLRVTRHAHGSLPSRLACLLALLPLIHHRSRALAPASGFRL